MATYGEPSSNYWVGQYMKANPGMQLSKKSKLDKKSAYANFLQAQQAMQYALAEKQMRLGLGDVQKGYAGAIANEALGADASRQDAANALKQSLGAINQGAVDRGLYGSTVQGAMNRGAYQDHVQNLAAVNQGLAQSLSQLQMSRANALAGARSGLAGLYQQRSSAETGLGTHLFNAMPSKKKKSGLFGALGGLAGSFLGPLGSAVGTTIGDKIGGGGYTGVGSLNYPGY